jgi:hypothetical protein
VRGLSAGISLATKICNAVAPTSPLRIAERPPSPSGLRFSRPLPAQRGEVKRRRADKQNRSRDTLLRPSFAHHHDAISKIDRPRQTHNPEKWCPVFGQDHAQKMKEAKRRKAHANHCRATSTNVAALRADRSFCRPTGDPGPPGSGSHSSARGHRIPLRLPKVPSRKAPLVSWGCERM